MSLREKLIRLAHTKPELRASLLPLLARDWESEVLRVVGDSRHPLDIDTIHHVYGVPMRAAVKAVNDLERGGFLEAIWPETVPSRQVGVATYRLTRKGRERLRGPSPAVPAWEPRGLERVVVELGLGESDIVDVEDDMIDFMWKGKVYSLERQGSEAVLLHIARDWGKTELARGRWGRGMARFLRQHLPR